VDSGSDENLLSIECLINVWDFDPFSIGPKSGFNDGIISISCSFPVNVDDVVWLFHGAKIFC
jgi:hypothetical protein